MRYFASKMTIWRSGDPFVWLSGGALALILLLLSGLFVVVTVNGFGAMWPKRTAKLELRSGDIVLGEIVERELIPPSRTSSVEAFRLQVKRGNRDLSGSDFVWLDEAEIERISYPEEAVVIERRQWGNFYGFPARLLWRNDVVAGAGDGSWRKLEKLLAEEQNIVRQIREIERNEAAALGYKQEKLRIEIKELEKRGAQSARLASARLRGKALQREYIELEQRLQAKRQLLSGVLEMRAAGDQLKRIELAEIVRIYQPNAMSWLERLLLCGQRIIEFVFDDPRESNTEGGVFPAIFGTVMMVLMMSITVTPLGVLAAIYLREYAKQGRFVSLVRIAVNNLAGVPSIVFGVFGLGFFVYTLGGSIDELFFEKYLPNPTFGTGGILWASLTLALLTLPTVIVATEEGLAAIPRSLREASYALGATKLETTWRIVIPSLVPSILTGMILAVARAAGEVAPLMITGVVKLAPSLPIDANWPFFHFDRKFMHLGFHIYDVGFQSPNVDAARPMVFATTVLLLLIVLLLNLSAIIFRARLRKVGLSGAL